ncbi:MAG: FAD-dependent oxidoreductase [Bacteroidales bacterium]|nr:FAD-dependent oxidoreductase [Bacteroidales bacterium]MDD3962323.1 FAD-dependent oxidoreductase [Bacteroidales bacterium]
MKTDVLVIGSSAAGLVAATTSKRVYPEKSVTVVTRQPKTLIPCGIPYIFGSVQTSDNNILPAEKMFESSGVDIIYDEVKAIDCKEKTITLENETVLEYEKLVIATGSTPYFPDWLPGVKLNHVYTVPKNKVYLDEMQKKLKNITKVVIIGAGFIGTEFSDELTKDGKEVILIEKLPHILGLAFDEDISVRAEKLLTERGVTIKTGVSVSEILGNEQVEGVKLENGDVIEAEAVVLAMGYRPNTTLAKKCNITLSKSGFIVVDEYMRTETPDIFAVGDCAEKRDFVTRKASNIMLASTACAEARIAGMNLFKLSAIKTFSGTISIFATAFGNTGFGVAGLTESIARAEGFDIITGVFEGIDRHPGTLSDTHKQYVKLIAGKESGVILGGEVAGGLSIGELTNTIGIMIQNRMSINSLLTAQIGTHPLLTASPAGYPLIKAAENAATKM